MSTATGERYMDGWLAGITGSAGTAALIGLGKWFVDRLKKDGAEVIEEKRLEELRAEIKSFRDELKVAVTEFRSGSMLTTELRASQAVVNTMTAKALDAIGTKQERHAEMLADHASTLKLLTDNVGLLRQRIDQVEKESRAK